MTSRRVVMRWHLRQVMATRGIFQTSELVPLLADRGVNLTRQYVHKLVTTAPQRINTDLLAALCDILHCQPNDLLQPVIAQAEQADTDTDTGTDGRADEGLGIGELRPIRAVVRRPHEPGD
ncbi:helix-turn-helix domain-containing protein [Nocardia sp. NPDC059180]|uniref:helix-turn-helix domain-containing protein n=1 Tax=Nocardia sp. NPDC059180 TaxID=3346761 RepID=UPI0036BDFBD7